MSLKLDVHGVVHSVFVLRPVRTSDNLWVEYKDDSISVVLHYMRMKGFEEEEHLRQKDPGLPKGVHKKQGKFRVKYVQDDGVKYTLFETPDEAKAFITGLKQQGEAVVEEAPDDED